MVTDDEAENSGQVLQGSAVKRTMAALRTKGVVHVVRSVSELMSYKVSTNAQFWYHRLLRSRRQFALDGRAYRYFYHKHNRTWLNERTVEIPFVWSVVDGIPSDSVLEVGNVLSNYFPVSHEIVDKYERAPGVLNIDVIDFRSDKRYKLIVTISTLEHVGWDEDPALKQRVDMSDDKIVRAIQNLQGHLTDDGELIITVPLGHNPILDSQLEHGAIPLETERFMVRVSKDNRWEQADWARCRGLKYGHPYTAANAIAILRVRKNSKAPGARAHQTAGTPTGGVSR